MDPPPTQYQIAFTVHPDYLYAHLTSDTISDEIIRGYVADILAECEAAGKDRILLYRDIPIVLSEGLVFHSVSESLAALKGKKVALVNPHASLRAPIDFGMTVGQNRGADYRYFDTIPAAEAWLTATN